MVRAAFWLLASFISVGAILILLNLHFLGLILMLMMAGEMAIMAVFMVMFMMNPAGLNPMMMVHQHRASVAAGVTAFGGLTLVAFFGVFPVGPARNPVGVPGQLGTELLGESMLVFQTAGVVLLATMIGAIAIAGSRGRFGSADEGSVEPVMEEIDPDGDPDSPDAPSHASAPR
jgi:NADH:ubiquinone oxidoreductase subunit 6 (subunit J)